MVVMDLCRAGLLPCSSLSHPPAVSDVLSEAAAVPGRSSVSPAEFIRAVILAHCLFFLLRQNSGNLILQIAQPDLDRIWLGRKKPSPKQNSSFSHGIPFLKQLMWTRAQETLEEEFSFWWEILSNKVRSRAGHIAGCKMPTENVLRTRNVFF